MSDPFDQPFAPSPDAISSRVGDETVILQTSKGAYFGLDAVATHIWTLLKDGVTPPEICARIAADYGVEQSVVEGDVRAFLTELAANGIIAEADPPAD